MCKDITGCNFCGGQRRKPNKNKIKSTPTQNPLPTGPMVPMGPKGHKGTGPKNKIKSTRTQSQLPTGPKGLSDPIRKQWYKNSPYQNPHLDLGPEWNTTGVEDSNRKTVDHDLNIKTPTVKKVIYLETVK